MAEFLTTSGTSYNIERIIQEAQSELFLVSPYLQLSKTLFERLRDASSRGVNIYLIYGKDELRYNERENLTQIDTLNLYFFENLHAKCYFNEKTMVITSMNMYEFSEKNNREMGVLINLEQDSGLYQRAFDETKSILSSSEIKQKATYYKSQNNFSNTAKHNPGHCIRCHDEIEYNPERPYCWDCYSIWVQFCNLYYVENVCHCCGNNVSTSMSQPLCESCNHNNNF